MLAPFFFIALGVLARAEVPSAGPGSPVALVPARIAEADRESTAFPEAFGLKSRLLLPPAGADGDGDGLADDAEAELAGRLTPFFLFDEDERFRLPNEPKTLFQVRPRGCSGPRSRCGGRPLVLTATFLHLWRMDGGYGPSSWCGSAHKGDNQAVRVEVVSVDDGWTFRVREVAAGPFSWPKKSGAVRFLGGTHIWVFPSAGKHHFFLDTRFDGRDSPHSEWGCNDNVDGRGDLILTDIRGGADSFPFSNVGEPERHPESRFVGRLDRYGFNGEHAWDTANFCGGLACASDNPTSPNAGKWSRESFSVPNSKN